MPKAFDFILQHEFAALQFDNPEIVGRQMLEGLVQFAFQNFVFPFQFNEMRLNRHKKSPLYTVDLRSDLDQEVYISRDLCRRESKSAHLFLTPRCEFRKNPGTNCEKIGREVPLGGSGNVFLRRRPVGITGKVSSSSSHPASIIMVDQDNHEFAQELARLQQEHRDLDVAIEALQQSPAPDLLRLQRLKKRKLALRDRIAYIEDQMTPDIIA